MVVLTTSRGWPSVVTSNILRPAPSSRLENLMGFFSSLVGTGPGKLLATAVMAKGGFEVRGLTKAVGCFFAEGTVSARVEAEEAGRW